MNTKVEKLPKATIKITVTVENDKVKETFEKVLDNAVTETTIEGFRKGNAPRDLVKNKVGLNKLYGDVINTVLQTYYPQAVKENHINVIANPKVEIQEFDIDKDMQFTAEVAVRPEVKVGEYKDKLKKLYEEKKASAKKANEEKVKAGEPMEEPHVHLSPNEVIDVLLNAATLEISDLLTDEETDRMMTRLVDQAQSIGLSLEQYLKAQNKTAEQLRGDYKAMAERNIKAEFVLGQLVIENKLEVTDAEIEETVRAAGFEEEEVKKRMEDMVEKFYVKSILQKNKLINNLIEEAEGADHHEHK